MSEPLRPIPTPPAQLWRQVRLQYVPVLVFVVGLVAAFTLWHRWVAPATMIGEVDTVRTEVRADKAGRLADLTVDLLQPVSAGQVIGHIVPAEPRVAEASLAVVRAGIETLRTTLEPVVGQQRMTLDFERLQLDWLSKRVELASLQGQLAQAESTLTRVTALHQVKMVPDEQFDEARQTRDTLASQVKALDELVRQMEPRLKNFGADSTIASGSPAAGLRAAIAEKEQELRLAEAQLSPAALIAPIDGIVTLVHRRAGETLVAGDAIVQVTAASSDRIVGFVREPLSFEPKPGMAVEVRTRTFQRRVGTARVTQVGRQLEPITPTLLSAMRLPVSSIPTELGLRVLIAAPKDLPLRPGEHVDVIIRE